jgi:hypothetical protein
MVQMIIPGIRNGIGGGAEKGSILKNAAQSPLRASLLVKQIKFGDPKNYWNEGHADHNVFSQFECMGQFWSNVYHFCIPFLLPSTWPHRSYS